MRKVLHPKSIMLHTEPNYNNSISTLISKNPTHYNTQEHTETIRAYPRSQETTKAFFLTSGSECQ